MWKLVQWLLIVAAYGYLIYRLSTYDDWSSLSTHFHHAYAWQYIALVLAIALFPLNILFESIKWRYLLQDIEPMSIAQAQRQTYFGFIGAFLTPSRVGDYPARVTMMRNKHHWAQAITLGFVGTLALAFLQVMVGMPSCIILLERVGDMRSMEIICAAVFVLMILCIIFYPSLSLRCARKVNDGKWKDIFICLSQFSHKRFATTFLLSMLRYTVYCLQLWLVLCFCGIELTALEAIISIPAYYLLVTVTPSVPVVDAAVRGSWSMVIFSLFTPNIPAIAIAAILLWVLNTILPMLVGTLVPKTKQ